MTLTVADFWGLIDEARRRAEHSLAAEPEILVELLTERTSAERRAFNVHLEALQLGAHHWNTLGPALIIGCGESDDGYLDFRLWLISLGKEAYERTLVDPEWLAELEVDDPLEEWYFEELYGVASAASEEAGEGELDYYPADHGAMLGEPCGTDDESLAARFPRLWERFGRRDEDEDEDEDDAEA
jgi:DNA-binding transcriptional ArsR family regulator